MLSGCGVNNIPTFDEQLKENWAQVENQYQRWADLVPITPRSAHSLGVSGTILSTAI